MRTNKTPRIICGGLALLTVGWFLMLMPESRSAPPEKTVGEFEEPAPPADQEYIGTFQCASCHFKQFQVWQKSKHTKAFEVLPAKYRNDAECLKCHVTGYGEPTGYKGSSTPQLAAVSCEMCHGPGSKHAEISKQFAKKKELSPKEKQAALDSIWHLKTNVCITCHSPQSHKPHPEYDKE